MRNDLSTSFVYPVFMGHVYPVLMGYVPRATKMLHEDGKLRASLHGT
jgi:hypothetical protein